MPCLLRLGTRCLAGAAALCLASLLTPAKGGLWPQGSQTDIRRHFAEASAATQRRDFARAEEEYRKILNLDPRSAQALNNLGMVYYLQHKYFQAEQVLVKAVRIDSSLINARVLLGSSYWREGKMKQAIAELEPTLETHLSDSAEKNVRTALHSALFTEGEYARALAVLKPLAEKYPRDVDVLYSLGQTYLELAEQSFLGIGAVDPQSYRVHQILAEALAKQGRYRDAIVEYLQVLQLRPDLPSIHYQVGLLHWLNELNTAGEDAAISEFQEELKINPFDPWSEYRLGQIYRKRHDFEVASLHFHRALEIDPDFVPAHVALAHHLEDEGKLVEAQNHLEIVQKLEPDNFVVHFRLARLFRKLGDTVAAGKEMAKFEEIKGRQREAQHALKEAIRGAAQPMIDTLDDPEN